MKKIDNASLTDLLALADEICQAERCTARQARASARCGNGRAGWMRMKTRSWLSLRCCRCQGRRSSRRRKVPRGGNYR